MKKKPAAAKKKAKAKADMSSHMMTTTQPTAWIKSWKAHMQKTGRDNLSRFISEAVNALIAREGGRIEGERPERGRHSA